MKYQAKESVHWIYLEKGELVMETLTDYCRQHSIENGQITGIGAVANIQMGVFVPETKSYHQDRFEGTYELTSFIGNITMKDGSPFIHAHIVLGDHEFRAISGHCMEMEVAVVGEFIIQKMETQVFRTLNPSVGLATWTMEEIHE